MIKRLSDGRFKINVSVWQSGKRQHIIKCRKLNCEICSKLPDRIDRDIAKEIERQFEKELKVIRSSTPAIGSLTPITQIADMLQEYARHRNLKRQQSTYDRLMLEIGNRTPPESYIAIRDFIRVHQTAGDLSNASINRHIAMFKASLNEAYSAYADYEWASKVIPDPRRFRKLLLPENNINYLILSDSQMQLFWDSLDLRLKPFTYFSWRVPIREGEALNITRDHIDIFNGLIKLPYEYQKNSDQRQIKIFPEFVSYVRQFMASPAHYLFNRGPAENYEPLGYLSQKTGKVEFSLKKPWKVSAILAGAPEYNLHKMRQQAVMTLYAQGWSEEEVMLYGGWKSRGAFDHYFNREMALMIKQGHHTINDSWQIEFAREFRKAA